MMFDILAILVMCLRAWFCSSIGFGPTVLVLLIAKEGGKTVQKLFLKFLICIESNLEEKGKWLKLFILLGSAESNNNENSESNNGGSSGGDDGGGGGDNKPPGGDWWKNFREINPQGFAIGVAVAAVGALLLMNASGMESREINWQEFRTKYLERGEVSVGNICLFWVWCLMNKALAGKYSTVLINNCKARSSKLGCSVLPCLRLSFGFCSLARSFRD